MTKFKCSVCGNGPFSTGETVYKVHEDGVVYRCEKHLKEGDVSEDVLLKAAQVEKVLHGGKEQ